MSTIAIWRIRWFIEGMVRKGRQEDPRIVFPPGTYVLSEPITIEGGVHVVGYGNPLLRADYLTEDS